jgi:sortase A
MADGAEVDKLICMHESLPLSRAAVHRLKTLRKLEVIFLICGLVLLAIYVSALVHGSLLSRIELQQFMQSRHASGSATGGDAHQASTFPDIKLWSKARIVAYEQSLGAHLASPLAVLSIPRIGLEVPLLEGTDDLTLNRGVGHITGTPRPGEEGNIGVAGHRDGFFRGLKDVAVGDEMELLLPNGSETYIVDNMQIVDPREVSVLERGPRNSLTLVTCYPFYFIGDAPQRYIVHAAVRESNSRISGSRTAAESARPNSKN